MTEPMTAAEYRQWCNVGLGVNTERVLAALEERERLLGEVAVLTDERDRARHEAAEVRRLTEADAPFTEVGRGLVDSGCTGAEWHRLLGRARAAWDSLLPKEPEVVTGPSGWRYEPVALVPGMWRQVRGMISTHLFTAASMDEVVPPCDAPVVAKLLQGVR